MMFPEEEREKENREERRRNERTMAGQGRRAGRILRSACKPISISSEIRLSEFLAARARLSRPRGPQLVYWPLACPRACRDSKIHLNIRCVILRIRGRSQINATSFTAHGASASIRCYYLKNFDSILT